MTKAPLLPPGPPSDATTLVHARPQPSRASSSAQGSPAPAGSARGQHRLTRRVPVCLGVGFESDSSNFTGITADISEGGLFVATHTLPPIGSEIDLRFSLPSGPELRVRGIVRWLRDSYDAGSAPPGIGVQFSALAEQDLARIRAFVDQSEPTYLES